MHRAIVVLKQPIRSSRQSSAGPYGQKPCPSGPICVEKVEKFAGRASAISGQSKNLSAGLHQSSNGYRTCFPVSNCFETVKKLARQDLAVMKRSENLPAGSQSSQNGLSVCLPANSYLQKLRNVSCRVAAVLKRFRNWSPGRSCPKTFKKLARRV